MKLKRIKRCQFFGPTLYIKCDAEMEQMFVTAAAAELPK